MGNTGGLTDKKKLSILRDIVADQAMDGELWFIPVTASEGFLQQELRRLHSVIESKV